MKNWLFRKLIKAILWFLFIEKIAFLNVKLLFNNIPLKETTNLCVQKLFEDKDYTDGLTKDSFCKMLTVTMTESFISFDNECYRQRDGVTMGFPIGPTFTNIYLCVQTILLFEKCRPKFRPVIYGSMLMTLFCFKISMKLETLKITLTFNLLVLILPLEFRLIICYLYLTSKLLEKTINSLPQFIASLHSVVRLLWEFYT